MTLIIKKNNTNTTIPENGGIINLGTTDITKVNVIKNNTTTTVWEKIEYIVNNSPPFKSAGWTGSSSTNGYSSSAIVNENNLDMYFNLTGWTSGTGYFYCPYIIPTAEYKSITITQAGYYNSISGSVQIAYSDDGTTWGSYSTSSTISTSYKYAKFRITFSANNGSGDNKGYGGRVSAVYINKR